MNELDRITVNPAVMGGKPCIRVMRVTGGAIVGQITWRAEEREVALSRA